MIKIYPKINNNYKINFSGSSISQKDTQEFIKDVERIMLDVDTVGNDPFNRHLAKDLSKVDRDGKPKNLGTPEQRAVMQDKVEKLVGNDGGGGLKKELSDTFKKFDKNANVPPDYVPKWVQKMFSKWSDSKAVKYLMKKGPKGIALALAAGNVGKELVGTTVYTVQALTNEDLPADKRKFIGMYDLIVGLISTTFSAVFGFGAVAVQDKLIKKALEKNKGAGFPKYASAFAGLVWLIPQLLQTIIGKRIVAPAFATPIAGKIKNKMIAKAEAKKALETENTAPMVAEAPKTAKTVELKPTETSQDVKTDAQAPKETVTVQFVSLTSYVEDANQAKNAA